MAAKLTATLTEHSWLEDGYTEQTGLIDALRRRKVMRISSIPFGILLLLIVPVWAQNSPSFTLEQSKAFHQPFDPRRFIEWNRRGDFTRYVYLNAGEFWVTTSLMRSEPIVRLDRAERADVANFKMTVGKAPWSLKDYVRGSPTDAVIVVHKGRIVFEDYPRMQPQEQHLWYSVSKTFVSTAVAILEDRGKISVNKPIDSYLLDLKGSAWAGIRVIDILDMASGVDCVEEHEFKTIFGTFYDALGWPAVDKIGRPREVLKTMRRLRPAGKVREYTSVNTEVLSWLVEAVSGERYANFIERELWQRLGAEHDALIVSTPSGEVFSAGGVCTTLRDLARFGMLFTPSGRSGAAPIISNAYLKKIQKGGRPNLIQGRDLEWFRSLSTIAKGDTLTCTTYQWDVTANGDLYKGGYGGQGLYVSPGKDLVVAWFGTYTTEGKPNWMLLAALQLAHSELFPR